MFHEFGHALHGLNSNVTYPSLSGTAVARDYVEFPSQLLEHWLSTPEVLQRFAVHYKTGKPIPQNLVERIKRAATFNEGFITVEYLAAALVDMKLHLAGDQKIDADAFEKKTLTELGMPDEIVMRHRTPQFMHVFSSDGYSAGYYSYLWSDVLTADAFGAGSFVRDGRLPAPHPAGNGTGWGVWNRTASCGWANGGTGPSMAWASGFRYPRRPSKAGSSRTAAARRRTWASLSTENPRAAGRSRTRRAATMAPGMMGEGMATGHSFGAPTGPGAATDSAARWAK
jgi:hypothetical protein